MRRSTLGLLAFCILFYGCHGLVVVFQEGTGESTSASGALHHQTSVFSFSDEPTAFGFVLHGDDHSTSSIFTPLLHPVTWFEQQLEALDALQQAVVENMFIQRAEAEELQRMQVVEDMESEMLQHVGCQRYKQAMEDRHQASRPTSLPATQHFPFRAEALHQRRSAPWLQDLLQETSSEEDDWFRDILGGSEGVVADEAEERQAREWLDAWERREAGRIRWSEVLQRAAWRQEEDGDADDTWRQEEDANADDAWFGDLNEDARSDVVDLISVSALDLVRGIEQEQRLEQAPQKQGQQGQQQGAAAAFPELLLRGSGHGGPSLVAVPHHEPQPQVRKADIMVEMATSDEGDYDALSLAGRSSWLLGSRSNLLEEFTLLMALVWPFTQPTAQLPSSTPSTSTWMLDDPALMLPEHFSEEELSASLAWYTQQRSSWEEPRGGNGAGRWTLLLGGVSGLDLDGDGAVDVELVLVQADGRVNWRLVSLLVLLAGTAVMAVAFVRALLQLRRAMLRRGRRRHVLVPVSVERGDGELLEGLLLVPEEEQAEMGGKGGGWTGTVKGGYQLVQGVEGKGEGEGEGKKGEKSQSWGWGMTGAEMEVEGSGEVAAAVEEEGGQREREMGEELRVVVAAEYMQQQQQKEGEKL